MTVNKKLTSILKEGAISLINSLEETLPKCRLSVEHVITESEQSLRRGHCDLVEMGEQVRQLEQWEALRDTVRGHEEHLATVKRDVGYAMFTSCADLIEAVVATHQKLGQSGVTVMPIEGPTAEMLREFLSTLRTADQADSPSETH